MSGLDALLGIVRDRGTDLELQGAINFKSGLKATVNTATEAIDVTFDGSIVPTMAVPVNPTDDGKIWYASAGAGVLTSTVKIANSGASLTFGSNPGSVSPISVISCFSTKW